MYQRFQLSHSDALRIIDAIRAKLEEQGKGAAIAVVDSQGELLAFCVLMAVSCPRLQLPSTRRLPQPVNSARPKKLATRPAKSSGP